MTEQKKEEQPCQTELAEHIDPKLTDYVCSANQGWTELYDNVSSYLSKTDIGMKRLQERLNYLERLTVRGDMSKENGLLDEIRKSRNTILKLLTDVEETKILATDVASKLIAANREVAQAEAAETLQKEDLSKQIGTVQAIAAMHNQPPVMATQMPSVEKTAMGSAVMKLAEEVEALQKQQRVQEAVSAPIAIPVQVPNSEPDVLDKLGELMNTNSSQVAPIPERREVGMLSALQVPNIVEYERDFDKAKTDLENKGDVMVNEMTKKNAEVITEQEKLLDGLKPPNLNELEIVYRGLKSLKSESEHQVKEYLASLILAGNKEAVNEFVKELRNDQIIVKRNGIELNGNEHYEPSPFLLPSPSPTSSFISKIRGLFISKPKVQPSDIEKEIREKSAKILELESIKSKLEDDVNNGTLKYNNVLNILEAKNKTLKDTNATLKTVLRQIDLNNKAAGKTDEMAVQLFASINLLENNLMENQEVIKTLRNNAQSSDNANVDKIQAMQNTLIHRDEETQAIIEELKIKLGNSGVEKAKMEYLHNKLKQSLDDQEKALREAQSRNYELAENSEKLTTKIAVIKLEKANLEQQKAEAETEMAQELKEEQLKTIQESHNKCAGQLSNLESKLQSKFAENNDLNVKFEEMKKQTEQARAINKELTTKITTMELSLKNLEKQNKETESELEKTKQNLIREVEEKNQLVLTLEREKEDQKKALEKAEGEKIVSTESLQKEFQLRNEQLVQEKQLYIYEKENQKKEFDQKLHEANEAIEKIVQEKNMVEKNNTDNLAVIETLQKNNEAISSELNQLKLSIEDKEGNLINKQKELDEVLRQNKLTKDELDQRTFENDVKYGEIRGLRTEIEKHNEKENELNLKITQQNEYIVALRNENQVTKQHLAELEKFKKFENEKKSLEKTLSDLENDKKKLQEQLKKKDTGYNKYQKYKRGYEALLYEINHSQDPKFTQYKTYRNMKTQNEELQKLNSQLETQIKLLEQQSNNSSVLKKETGIGKLRKPKLEWKKPMLQFEKPILKFGTINKPMLKYE